MCSFVYMNKRLLYIAPLLLTIVFSCKKKTDAPAFSINTAVGFWRGYISTGAVVAIANQPNGNSAFYGFLPNLDTATAPQKFYGTYTVANGVFHGDYHTLTHQPQQQDTLSVETIQATSLFMTGIVVHSSRYNDTVTGVNALTFQLIKQ